jgi:FKBP12-rapamycin complex-associated protein
MLKVLLPRARDRKASVAAAVMLALGELARVGGPDITPRVHEYMALILETVHDQSSTAKRDAALKCLGLLASNSGYVIDPYTDYPPLLPTLISILRTEQAPQTRRETVRVMGILGALDPYHRTVSVLFGCLSYATDIGNFLGCRQRFENH